MYNVAANGLFSNPATWVGGIVPPAGAEIFVPEFRTLTIDDARIIGAALTDADPDVFSCEGGVIVTDTGVVRLRGNSRHLFDSLRFQGRAQWIFDASQATDPFNTHFTTRLNRPGKLIAAGIDRFNYAHAWSDPAGGNGYFSGAETFGGGGGITGSFIKFTNIGDDVRPMALIDIETLYNLSLTDVVCDGCGEFQFASGAQDGSDVSIKRMVMRNTRGDICFRTGNGSALTSGQRLMQDCDFDKIVRMYSPRGWTFDHVFFNGGFLTTVGQWPLMTRCFVRMLDVVLPEGDSTDTHYILDDVSNLNPHLVAPDGAADLDMTFIGCSFEYTGPSEQGDCFLLPNAPGRLYILDRCIVLPNHINGLQSGTILTALNNSNARVIHCTFRVSGSSPGISVAETYPGHVDQVRVRDSIGWAIPGETNPGALVINNRDPEDPIIEDIILPTEAHHNGYWGFINPYRTPMSGIPGEGDVNADPSFVDKTRNLATWDLSKGGPGTVVHALAQMLMRNDFDAPSDDWTPDEYRTWMRYGFSPTNVAYHNTASDGGDIGAMPWVERVSIAIGTATMQRWRSSGLAATYAVAIGASAFKRFMSSGMATAEPLPPVIVPDVFSRIRGRAANVIAKYGATVWFSHEGTAAYEDPNNPGTWIEAVDGVHFDAKAIQTRGDPDELGLGLAKANLILNNPVTVLVASVIEREPNVFEPIEHEPVPNLNFTWAGIDYKIIKVLPVAPSGEPIYYVVVGDT